MEVYVMRKGAHHSASVHAVLVLRTFDEVSAVDGRAAAPADDAQVNNVRTDEKPATGIA